MYSHLYFLVIFLIGDYSKQLINYAVIIQFISMDAVIPDYRGICRVCLYNGVKKAW